MYKTFRVIMLIWLAFSLGLVVQDVSASGDDTLKEKIIAMRKQSRAMDQQHTASIRELRTMIQLLQDRIASLEEKLAQIDEEPEPELTSLPKEINGLSDLKTFIKNHPGLGEVWAKTYYSEKKIPCAVLRDELTNYYSDIERVNDQEFRFGYRVGDEKHRDAVVVVRMGEVKIYDFCIGSSAPGNLWDSLCWVHEEITPWGVR